MRRYALVLLCLGALLASCNPRNFGQQKLLHILVYDLRERVEKFCHEHQRPPTAEEAGFTHTPLLNDYWFISDYAQGKDGPYVVLLIDRLSLEQLVVYRGGDQKVTP